MVENEKYSISFKSGASEYPTLLSSIKSLSIDDVHIERVSTICSAPIETGIKSQDHIVIEPTIVTVELHSYNYDEGRTAEFLGHVRKWDDTFSVSTRDDFVDNLAIRAVRSHNDKSIFDLTAITIVFEELIFIQTEINSRRRKLEDSKTQNTGNQNPEQEEE